MLVAGRGGRRPARGAAGCVRALTAITIVAVIALTATRAVGSAATAGGIGLAPAHGDPSRPVTEAYFVLDVDPGQSRSDAVLVSNTAGVPTDVLVDAVDGITGVTSGAVYANRADPAHGAGAWITAALSSITIAAASRSTVAFTVRVPVGTAPGDHLAGLAFENAHPSTSRGRLAVTTVTRSVIGILVRIPGPSSFHLHIDRAQIQQQPGGSGQSVVVTLGNDGAALGKPALAVSVDGPSGYRRFFYRQLDTILPGDTIPYPVALPDNLAPGDYRLEVSGAEETLPSPVTLTSTVHFAFGVLGAEATRSPTIVASPAARWVGVPVWVILSLLAATIAGGAAGAAVTWRLARRG
jgi:hypothetical protein